MMKQLLLLLITVLMPLVNLAQDLTGVWEAKIKTDGRAYTYSVNLSKSSVNQYTGVLFIKQTSVGRTISAGYGSTTTINIGDMFEKKPTVKAGITALFANGKLSLHVIEIFETQGNVSNWHVGDMWLDYSNAGNAAKLISMQSSNLEFTKKREEFPAEYTDYLSKQAAKFDAVAYWNAKNDNQQRSASGGSVDQNANITTNNSEQSTNLPAKKENAYTASQNVIYDHNSNSTQSASQSASLSVSPKNHFNEIKGVWEMIQNAKPVQIDNPELNNQRSRGVCMSGNCVTGHGLAVGWHRQFEGEYENGITVRGVITDYSDGVCQIKGFDGDIEINVIDGLPKLSNHKNPEMGLSLDDIIYFQNMVFKNFQHVGNSGDVLIEINDFTVSTTTHLNHETRYTIGGNVYDTRWVDKTEEHKVNGYKNIFAHNVYVRAYCKSRVSDFKLKDNSISYFDRSIVLAPDQGMVRVDFNADHNDNRRVITTDTLFNMTSDNADKKGYSEYTNYEGLYTDDVQRPTINDRHISDIEKKVNISLGDDKAKIDVQAGKYLSMTADGTVLINPVLGSCDPNGLGQNVQYSYFRDFPVGALLYRIGGGKWHVLGKQVRQQISKSGRLEFFINVGDTSASRGSFITSVSVTSN